MFDLILYNFVNIVRMVVIIENSSDILEIFFREIKLKGKYEIDIRNNIAYIIPREEEQYYKPIIKIPDLNYFTTLLIEYIKSIKNFNKKIIFN